MTATGGVQGLLELVKPMAVQLKEWANDMPQDLRMDDVKTRKLCSNGYLHLSYFVTEMIIHRHIIRSLTPKRPKPSANSVVRPVKPVWNEPSTLLRRCGQSISKRFGGSHPRISCFHPNIWWAALGDELHGRRGRILPAQARRLRWSLKVRAKGVSFVAASLQEMDESLQDIDMTQSPVGRSGQGVTFYQTAGSARSVVGSASDAETQTPRQDHGIYHGHQLDSWRRRQTSACWRWTPPRRTTTFLIWTRLLLLRVGSVVGYMGKP